MFEKWIDKIQKREVELRDPISEKINKIEDYKFLVGDIFSYHLSIMQNDENSTPEDLENTNKYMRQLLVKGVESNADIVADFIGENAQELAVALMTYASTQTIQDVSNTIWKKRDLKAQLDTEARFDVITDNILSYLGMKGGNK